MANLFDRLFGNYDDDEYEEFEDLDDYQDLEEYDTPKFESRPRQETSSGSFLDRFSSASNKRPTPAERPRPHNQARVLDMRSGESVEYDSEVVIMVPYNFEVTKQVCDYVKSGKTVICNIEKIDNETAQRVLDFIMGATYALAGSLESISEKIFVVTPASTRLSTRLDDRQNTQNQAQAQMRTGQAGMRRDRRFETAPTPAYDPRVAGFGARRAANQ